MITTTRTARPTHRRADLRGGEQDAGSPLGSRAAVHTGRALSALVIAFLFFRRGGQAAAAAAVG